MIYTVLQSSVTPTCFDIKLCQPLGFHKPSLKTAKIYHNIIVILYITYNYYIILQISVEYIKILVIKTIQYM
jgi:hypothetical protein